MISVLLRDCTKRSTFLIVNKLTKKKKPIFERRILPWSQQTNSIILIKNENINNTYSHSLLFQ